MLNVPVATHTVTAPIALPQAMSFGVSPITSALLTTTMMEQKALEETLRSEGLRERFKTIVGGAPVTKRWAAKIGADAYAETAMEGVGKVRELLA